MSSVRVAVRVRPLNKREKLLSSNVIINMSGNSTSIHKPLPCRGEKLKDRGKTFSYDYSYDSTDVNSPTFASQEKIFKDLGSDVLKATFDGFNACVFAYGQTGSGKSYTMMGNKADKGLIPRICEELFLDISNRSKSEAMSFHTEVSYLEIYNERVQDLLKKRTPCSETAGLKVREHPTDGPYVENLSKHLVHSQSNMESLIILGNANRTIASTGMNDFSSRSHTIFTITFTQGWFDGALPHERRSKIHLVDLAGSERVDSTHTTGTRLKEGANINKSLVTLGSVISALADLAMRGQSGKRKQIFIPYRDSVLTWLLKDSLGGNSITTIVATISPADVNYEETLSTLRFASRAKNIMTMPIVNEDGSTKVIRELQAEVTRLRSLLAEAAQVFDGDWCATVKEGEMRNQVEPLTKKWSTKWRDAQDVLEEKSVALRKEGSGVILDCQLPHLIGINEDLLTTGIILYYLNEGRTLIGSDEALCSQGIVLSGPELLREHCLLENCAGIVTLLPQDGALCSVNGSVVTHPCQLNQGAIIQLGRGPILRFNHSAEASQLKKKQQSGLLSASSSSLTDSSKSAENLSKAKLQISGDMDMSATEGKSGDPDICLQSTLQSTEKMTTAIPKRDPVPQTLFQLGTDALQGQGSIWDGQEQERDSCHKSGPGLVSESLQRTAQSGAGVASSERGDVSSGDGSLQQTCVLGPGDGCGMKPEGNANEIQGVDAECYKGRPFSGGTSLGSMSLLQKSGGSSFLSVLPQTNTYSQANRKSLSSQVACCPPKDTAFQDQYSSSGMDESESLGEIKGTAENAGKKSMLGSLFGKVSCFVLGARQLLRRSPAIVHKLTTAKLQPVGVCLSSRILSIVRDSYILSKVEGSFAFSLISKSPIFSVVKALPVIQHIQMNITHHLQSKEAALMIQDCNNLNKPSQLSPLMQTVTEKMVDWLQISEDFSKLDLDSPKKQVENNIQIKQDKVILEPLFPKQTLPVPYSKGCETEVIPTPEAVDQAETVDIYIQTLIKFPNPLLKLQTLSLRDLTGVLQSVSRLELPSQKIIALHWLNIAKSSEPDPQPGLLILTKTGLYTLTANSGGMVLFHHLPLLQLRDIRMGFAGQSLRLMGTTEESILGVYAHSQKQTKELCWAILNALCCGDSRIYQYHPLNENLMKLSLACDFYAPDLQLNSGLKLCCRFQKSLTDLLYLIYCNIDEEGVTLGELKLLMYTSVSVHMSCQVHSEQLAQFFLTDTHLGLAREDVVFPKAKFPQFDILALCRCSDVRCILVHDEDGSGFVRLDVVVAKTEARGHPESVKMPVTPLEHPFNSSPHSEVWKLTFSCTAEATCLINHLSNV